MNFKQLVLESIEKDKGGLNFRAQSITNFVTGKLGLTIKTLGDCSCDFAPIEVVAENPNIPGQHYTFKVESNNSYTIYEPFTMVATLDKIEKNGEVYDCAIRFPFNLKAHDEVKKDILNKPLSAILNTKEEDADLSYIVSLILEKAKKSNYEVTYVEREPNQKKSFAIFLETRSITITSSFSNAIQIDFNNKRLFNADSLTVVYRERTNAEIQKEMNKVFDFIDSYLDKNVKVGEHNLSPLLQYLEEKKLWAEVNSSEVVKNDNPNIINEIVLGNPLEFNSASVDLKMKDSKLVVNVNYLMNEQEVIVDSVEDVIEIIEDISATLKK